MPLRKQEAQKLRLLAAHRDVVKRVIAQAKLCSGAVEADAVDRVVRVEG